MIYATSRSLRSRMPPTPEDAAIFERNMRRIFRWEAECADLPDAFSRGLIAINRACGDYMEERDAYLQAIDGAQWWKAFYRHNREQRGNDAGTDR